MLFFEHHEESDSIASSFPVSRHRSGCELDETTLKDRFNLTE
jgi:hypothetical protein